MAHYRSETYKRADGLWDWRLFASNGQIVSTSGGQGFTERNDAQEAVNMILNVIATEGLMAVESMDEDDAE